MNVPRHVVHTRHVLAVKDLKVETDHYLDQLGFDHDFSVPGWEFLSFGAFKVMLGECADAIPARETGDHSYYAHVLVENVDEIFAELVDRGAEFIFGLRDQPWEIREFGVVTPSGHRMVFGQLKT